LIRREAAADSPGSARGMKSARPSLESVPERSARENLEAAGSSVTEVGREGSNQEATHSQAERPDPAPRNQRENRSASNVALAIMGMPTGVSPTLAQETRPDVQPVPHHQTTKAADRPVSDAEKLEIPSPGDDEPTTPLFEDALANSQEQQAQADAQLQREAASGTAHDPSPSEPSAPAALLPIVHESERGADDAQVESAPPKATAPAPAEKSPSAVLARVRAMEGRGQNAAPAAAEKKLPGSFE
ncbi:hypothetical protein LTR33_017523, partial [Friedmanniomyces endolithicus]